VRRVVSVALAAIALALAGCGGDDDGDEATPPPPPPPAETGTDTETETDDGDGEATDGAAVFASAGCGSCHAFTPAGSSATIGPNLDDTSFSVDEIEAQVRSGGGGMPAFEGDLSDDEISAVAEYVAAG
jgi:mono/diheme cytochrome c family protein